MKGLCSATQPQPFYLPAVPTKTRQFFPFKNRLFICSTYGVRLQSPYTLYVCLFVFFALSDRVSTIPSNTVYGVANLIRGLLYRKRKGHLQSSNESTKTKTRQTRQKQKKQKQKCKYQKGWVGRRDAQKMEAWRMQTHACDTKMGPR